MFCTSFSIGRTIAKAFLIKIHLTLIMVIVSQNELVENVGKLLRNIMTKYIKCILIFLICSLICTTPEVLNVIKFTMIFEVKKSLCDSYHWFNFILTPQLHILKLRYQIEQRVNVLHSSLKSNLVTKLTSLGFNLRFELHLRKKGSQSTYFSFVTEEVAQYFLVTYHFCSLFKHKSYIFE